MALKKVKRPETDKSRVVHDDVSAEGTSDKVSTNGPNSQHTTSMYWIGSAEHPSDEEGTDGYHKSTTEVSEQESVGILNSECSINGIVETQHDENVGNTQTPQRPNATPFTSRNIFRTESLDVYTHIPDGLQVPHIPEGMLELTVADCQYSTETYGKRQGQKKAVIRFRTEDGEMIPQTYYLSQRNPNLAKLVAQVLGELPEGEFFLNSLTGKRVRAVLYHNYTANGQGFVNIAYCEPCT